MALFDAIGNIIGGFINATNTQKINKQQIALQRETTQKQLDFANLMATSGVQMKVADARAAGIHPLAALGASVVSPPALSTAQLNVPNSGSSFGNGIGALAKLFDPEARERSRLENEQMAAQTEMYRAQSRTMIMNAATNAQRLTVGRRGTDEDKSVGSTAWRFGDRRFSPERGLSDAQVIQNRHGELAENLWGLFTIPADIEQSINAGHGGRPRLNSWQMLARAYSRLLTGGM